MRNQDRATRARNFGPRPATIVLRDRTARRAEGALQYCPIPGCGRLPQARAGKGVSLYYCRYHAQAYNRHGCHWKKTYTAADLEPYRKAARSFIKARPHDIYITHALAWLDATMRFSGPLERMVDTYLMKPRDKALAALARMERRKVPPEQLLVNYLAVCCAIEEDPKRAGSETENYRRVQAAKACARLAATNLSDDHYPAHKRRYARSSGLMLVHLGRMLENACGHVQGHHLPAILALASETVASRGGRDAATA